jgi:hypothetical protein
MSRLKDIDIAKRLLRTEQSAKRRDIEFDLSFSKLKRLLNAKTCFFTGNKLNFDDPEHENYLTLDRVDASKGYVDDNLVACGRTFNMRKGEASAKDIVLIYKALKKKKLI